MCSARSARIRTTPPRSPTSRWRSWSSSRAIPRWWRSARRGSTITTITARATCRRRASAPISRPRARPACRSIIHARDADADIARMLEEETRQGRVPLRAALLHRRSRPGAARACARRLRSPSRASSPSRTPRRCATSRWRCRRTGCWSRPMRRISRPSRCAARPTSPLSWCIPRRGLLPCAACARPRWRA